MDHQLGDFHLILTLHLFLIAEENTKVYLFSAYLLFLYNNLPFPENSETK